MRKYLPGITSTREWKERRASARTCEIVRLCTHQQVLYRRHTSYYEFDDKECKYGGAGVEQGEVVLQTEVEQERICHG